MALITSSKFASVSASGTDWRDTAKNVLEQLESIKTDGVKFNLGFVYISDELVADAVSIVNLFKSVTGIDHWIGCNGIGVFGSGLVHMGGPAISTMVTGMDEESFSFFTTASEGSEDTQHNFENWKQKNETVLAYMHGIPLGDSEPEAAIVDLSYQIKTFMVGGLSSSRQGHVHIAGAVFEEGLSGICFSSGLEISTALSQGCQPMGGLHTITKCDEHFIYEIDGYPPFEVFEGDLRSFIQGKTSAEIDFEAIDEHEDDEAKFPEPFQNLMRGDIHIAFMVTGSDKKDFLVRNILGMDLEQNVLAVNYIPQVGDHIVFCHRDEETIQAELSTMLLDLRARVTKERGEFSPKGALYVSCLGRTMPEGMANSELEIIREIIGEIPLAGFYASGEISNQRLYGYTGIITLFF